MKSRKVLLGLFAGLAMCFVGTATAQNANYQNNNLVEIGPDNIGGRVTSLVVSLFTLALLLAASTPVPTPKRTSGTTSLATLMMRRSPSPSAA